MTTMTTIDCQTCPVRGRHCGDCFVPVLGRAWLQTPSVSPRTDPGEDGPGDDYSTARDTDRYLGPEPADPVPLDRAEEAAVEAFVRAGLVHPDEAAQACAELTGAGRYAVS